MGQRDIVVLRTLCHARGSMWEALAHEANWWKQARRSAIHASFGSCPSPKAVKCRFVQKMSRPRANAASGVPVLACVTCGVALLGFSGLLSFCIILQAILADRCGSPICFVLANLGGFLLPLLPPCVMRGFAG